MDCVTIAISRRSKRSEMLPPVTEKISSGANDTKFRRPTESAEPVRSYTNTEATTFWSQVPMFETRPPLHKTVTAVCAKGPSREVTPGIVCKPGHSVEPWRHRH